MLSMLCKCAVKRIQGRLFWSIILDDASSRSMVQSCAAVPYMKLGEENALATRSIKPVDDECQQQLI